MIFGSKDFYICSVENKDIEEVLEVYNSNVHFLINHLNIDKVSVEWINHEIESMREIGYLSCKIVDRSTLKIIGILDFKVDEEIYLSLLMIHNDFKGKGFGKIIFQLFEEYVKSLNSKSIRIDVVTNYDNAVLKFWINNGFNKFDEVELNWTGKILPALTMKKFL